MINYLILGVLMSISFQLYEINMWLRQNQEIQRVNSRNFDIPNKPAKRPPSIKKEDNR